MWEEIFKLAISNGIWAVMFLGLLVFQLRDSANREKKYQATINQLNEHLGVVNELKNDIDDIKNAVLTKRRKKKDESQKQVEEL